MLWAMWAPWYVGFVKIDGTPELIDLGSPLTWSESIQQVVAEIVVEVREWPEVINGCTSCDLGGHDYERTKEIEVRFRQVISTSSILAYHATRLLPHEVDSIQKFGLDPLSAELVERKLSAAAEHYPDLISEADIQLLQRSGPLTWQRGGIRLGLLWMVAPFAIFANETTGFRSLFGRWGGEVIGWTEDETSVCRPAADIIDRLSKVSRPSIVKLSIDPQAVPLNRALWPTAVGGILGCDNSWAEWALNGPVGADYVLGVIQPESGDSEGG